MTDASIVPVNRASSDELETSSIRSLIPNASKRLVANLRRLKLTGVSLKRALDVCSHYSVRPNSLVRWMDEGMSVARIEECLEVREATEISSVILIDKFLGSFNFKSQLPIDMLDAFNDIVKGFDMKSPWHYLMHRIDEIFDGDVLEAYRMCLEDPEQFALIMKRKGDYLQGRSQSVRSMLDPNELED